MMKKIRLDWRIFNFFCPILSFFAKFYHIDYQWFK